jgi:hypothetical protein
LKLTNAISTLFLLTSGWCSPSLSQVTSGQSYKIFSACDLNKVISVSGNSLLDNAPIVLQTDANLSSQIFKFETSAAGYKITATSSGKTLNIANASAAPNIKLEQYKFTGVLSEIFKLSTTADNYIRFQNLNSGLFLNLANGRTTEATPLEQYLNTTVCAEKFKLVLAVAPAPAPAPTPTPTPTAVRDPLKQPFSSKSIWNMPIGSGAVYVPAGLNNTNSNIWTPMPGADQERIFMTPTESLTPIYYNGVAWSGGNRCAPTGGLIVSVPMPANYIVANSTYNESASFLMPDRRTIVQTQPLARCTAGGAATSLLSFAPVDIYGDGRSGAHGGSGLSAIGGSIRIGELRPGGQPMRHALKVAVYAKEALYHCTTKSDCWRWPAYNSDSYSVGTYGALNNNQNKSMKMGALLALHSSINIASLNLETEPGKQIAWTLQNYGAYVVDDMGNSPGIIFDTEFGPNGSKVDEFQKDWGFAFTAKLAAPTAWQRDIQKLVKILNVIDNNTSTTIGGGGTPRQPLLPEIAP